MGIQSFIQSRDVTDNGLPEADYQVTDDSRIRRADIILSVCENFSHLPLDEMTCVDLGVSSSVAQERFAGSFKRVICVGQSKGFMTANRDSYAQNNIELVCCNRDEIALPDGCADVIICNQTYEYVANREGLMSEIYRLLKYGGFCYFCARNRYIIFDKPYYFPFMKILSHKIAEIYQRIAGRGDIDESRLLSLGQLKRLTKNFWRHDYTRMLIDHPECFAADDVIKKGNIYSRLPGVIFSFVYPFLPAWIWVLTKRK